MLKDRGCGILLHITSLPSLYAIGDLGPEAYRFVDFLVNSQIKYWQILPLNPINKSSGFSPYSSDSAFAGNILLISPELLVKDGFLNLSDLPENHSELDYEFARTIRLELLNKAYNLFKPNSDWRPDYEKFISHNKNWLEDYALYKTLKKIYSTVWDNWPDEYKNRYKDSLIKFQIENADEIDKTKFQQFVFYRQWFQLKSYCNEKNIQIIGDIPYYVNYDGADVWTDPELFKLDENKNMLFVSGVPPDYFSETGQLWGNPVYNWTKLKEQNYSWWIKRIEHNLTLSNMLRLDHFRAFSAYWEVDAAEETAMNGKWIKVPGEEFLNELNKSYNNIPLIAEDLGDIDEPVRELIRKFNLPGMKVLQFAFDHKINESPDALHNHIQNCVVYTGTHDNLTTRAWFNSINEEDKIKISDYTGNDINENNISQVFIRLAMMSTAKICIIPMQDFLNLGTEGTMNKPGTSEGNWKWQMKRNDLNQDLSDKIKKWVQLYQRN